MHPQSGSKAANLHFLQRYQIKVPSSWVVIWSALEDNRQNDTILKTSIRSELQAIVDPGRSYAVRSSASVEDGGNYSCAGLFKSYLNVQGIDEIISCVSKVWESQDSPEFLTYRQKNLSEKTPVHMAVIIQEMVQAVSSGVTFSKNPLTGLSETIIEAGGGNGDMQNQTRLDPERWICKWGNWQQKPEKGIISETLAQEIVRKTAEIARRYQRPVDLEWAWDGLELFFLQVRPITRLDIPIFSNRIAREMLPGMIKPLVWSVNTRLINQNWVDILIRLTGDRSFVPESLTGHFYYRAYFNMAIFGRVFERLGLPGEALELLFGLEQEGPDKPHMRPGPAILARIPGLARFTFSFFGISRQLKRLIQDKELAYRQLNERMTSGLTSAEWLDLAMQVHLITKKVAYFNIIIPMLAMMHHRLLTGLLKKRGYDARLLELDGAREAAERYNPQNNLQKLHDQFACDCPGDPDGTCHLIPGQEAQLQQAIEKFLQQFGHFSDSGNDCSSIPWRETPELIRRMILSSQRKQVIQTERLSIQDLQLKGLQRILIPLIYRRTSRLAVEREAISSLYTYGYGQFRTCFIHLGDQLMKQGVIEDKEDIFYLYWQELKDLVESQVLVSQKERVASRRQEIDQYRNAAVPELIFGTEQPPLVPTELTALRGIPTSLGTYTGPVKVIQGIIEFDRLQEGDVLVIPYSDVGWTPLFARAKALIAESGGILSHSSIVAREYQIPAVVSVPGACRLADGTVVTVDGFTGDIRLAAEA